MEVKLERLKGKIVPILAPYGVKRIALFGSVARGEETESSDVDLLITFEEPRPRPIGLFTWVRLERELSELLERPVEMVSEKALKPLIRPYVQRDLIVLYEKS
jgi:predicted nucleotidyltransferase